jgi:hypothetical protein
VSCGTAWESQNSFQADPDQAEAAAAMSALTASASSEARPVGHETRNAVEHLGQACLELLLPLILGEAGRPAVQRRETPGIDLVRGVDELARAAVVRDRLYRSRTRRRYCDLRFRWMSWLHQDQGSWLFVCST